MRPIVQQLFGRFRRRLGGYAEVLVEIGNLAAGAKTVHADEDAVEADEAVPAEANAGLDGDFHLGFSDDLGLVGVVLRLEQFEARHRHDAHGVAVPDQKIAGIDRNLDL